MSECVVRMEMPKNCINCDLRYECNAFYAPGKPKPFMKGCRIICQLPEGHGRLIDDLREKIDLWRKSTTDTALMSVPHDVLKQIDIAIYEMDHQEDESPWHRVEEPPKEHMWCFVYTHEPEMIMPIRIAFYVASCTGKGSWYHYESGEDIDDEVDYWMPMYLEGPDVDWPIEPPKEDT